MKLEDLHSESFESALRQAIAVMCQGLDPAPVRGLKGSPAVVEQPADERLAQTLQRARDAQPAIVARAYADRAPATLRGAPVKGGRSNYAAGQRAAMELLSLLERTGRGLTGWEDPKPQSAFDERIFEVLTALAAPEAPRRSAFGRLLSELLVDHDSPRELGPFLSAFVALAPVAPTEAGSALNTAAEELAPALAEQVQKEEPRLADREALLLAADLPVLVAHTLRVGARRLAWLADMRTTP